jgi:hypothetical protein
MTSHTLFGGLLAALAFGPTLLAQNSLPNAVAVGFPQPVFLQQTFTTGMVGFTTNQTARLNVLNLNPVPATAAGTQPTNCTVELQFFEAKNNMVAQTMVSNFAPGTATFLDHSLAGGHAPQ